MYGWDIFVWNFKVAPWNWIEQMASYICYLYGTNWCDEICITVESRVSCSYVYIPQCFSIAEIMLQWKYYRRIQYQFDGVGAYFNHVMPAVDVVICLLIIAYMWMI